MRGEAFEIWLALEEPASLADLASRLFRQSPAQSGVDRPLLDDLIRELEEIGVVERDERR